MVEIIQLGKKRKKITKKKIDTKKPITKKKIMKKKKIAKKTITKKKKIESKLKKIESKLKEIDSKRIDSKEKKKVSILDSNKPDDVKIKLYMGEIYSILKHYFENEKNNIYDTEISFSTPKMRRRKITFSTPLDSSAYKSLDSSIDSSRYSLSAYKSLDSSVDRYKDINFLTRGLIGKAKVRCVEMYKKLGEILDWNENREIIFNNSVIPNSDIRDVVDYLARRRKLSSRPNYLNIIEESIKKSDVNDLIIEKK